MFVYNTLQGLIQYTTWAVTFYRVFYRAFTAVECSELAHTKHYQFIGAFLKELTEKVS